MRRIFITSSILSICMLGSVCVGLAYAQHRPRLIESIDVQVPVPPSPVTIAGRDHLAYELHITNFARSSIEMFAIEVIAEDSGTSIARLQGESLQNAWRRIGEDTATAHSALAPPGSRSVVFLWMALPESEATPSRISHRFTFDIVGASGRERNVMQAASTLMPQRSLLVLDPPLRGGPWVALYDPFMMGGHRTSIYTIEGRARIPARFAIDWVRLEHDATYAKNDETRVANWHGYGTDVLAVADGVVVQAVDDMPTLERTDPSQGAMSLEEASGNYVVLDIGGNRYAFYEHLKHGSIRVKQGEKVRSGQIIGSLGNSGSSSSGPHLHFHVADNAAVLASEGVPFVFRSFELIGAYEQIDDFTKRIPWERVTDQQRIRGAELPAPNVVLMFSP